MSQRRIAALILIPALLIAGAVFAAARLERNAAVHAGDQQAASQQMLTAMLDQETGARGYFETRDPRFLGPWYEGSAAFVQALATSRSLAGSDPQLARMLDEQVSRSAEWNADVQMQLNRLSSAGQRPSVEQALADKAVMDRFRADNASFTALLLAQRNAALSFASWAGGGLAAGLSILLICAALLLLRQTARRESERLRRQRELRELLQASESESESRMLLIRHIERAVPGSAVAVLNRNHSDDRLEPVLADRAAQTPLRDLSTEQLKPRSCMAVRLSHSYERPPGEAPLLECEVCGKIGADVACEPMLVGGQVIGSVLVAREKVIDARDRSRLRDSVVQAAPILANQRNLALAETRAASDPLTGLPNRRAADETLTRLAAHAGRTVSPLAAVLIDLDHFKQINDVHGHEQGDKALAAVGQMLNATLRASDFAARYGGEEFLILLPDTDQFGAYGVAEKLRTAIEHAEIAPISTLTASFGIAVLPDDASRPEQLMRKADRALYAAKAHGRNRVETAAAPGGAPGGGDGPELS